MLEEGRPGPNDTVWHYWTEPPRWRVQKMCGATWRPRRPLVRKLSGAVVLCEVLLVGWGEEVVGAYVPRTPLCWRWSPNRVVRLTALKEAGNCQLRKDHPGRFHKFIVRGHMVSWEDKDGDV